jgi:hypothetical protein
MKSGRKGAEIDMTSRFEGPDPNGPIHLTGFDINFQDTDRIITHISGYDDLSCLDPSIFLSSPPNLLKFLRSLPSEACP